MFINDSMTQRVITIHHDTLLLEARDLMKTYNIRHLPVVAEDNTLIGLVTDRDIRSAMPSTILQENEIPEIQERLATLTVDKIMTTKPNTLSPMDTIQDALLLIQQTRVGAMPVVDRQGKLKGILSVRDLVRAFINVMGIGQPGTLLGILVDEKVGQLKKIVDAITEERISFGSVLMARHWREDKRAVFPYLLTNNVANIKRKLKNMGYTLIEPMEWYLDQVPKSE